MLRGDEVMGKPSLHLSSAGVLKTGWGICDLTGVEKGFKLVSFRCRFNESSISICSSVGVDLIELGEGISGNGRETKAGGYVIFRC